MKAITLCLWTTWTALLMVHELLADGTRTCYAVPRRIRIVSFNDAGLRAVTPDDEILRDVSLCSEEGIFPRTDHCRLLILCLKSKTQTSQWKEYLLSCPYGYNFNNFMMSCYDFQQECALEEGSAVNKKLAKAWSLTLPNEPESCKGAKAPFCTDDEMLTICHPFSKKVLGYVNCKEKDATHSYCDRDEGKCKRRTSSTTTTQKNDVMVPEQPTDGDDSLCSEEGIFPRSEHCRLLIICLKSKTQSSQWKQYLLSCPYGYNFNHFMMSCYDFQQDCALEKGSAVNKKLAKSWSLILPDESESCKGAKAPFCMDEEMLTICHPFSKKVLGYVNCKEKDATHSYCDQDEGICKRRTSSTATTTTTATTDGNNME